MQTAANLWLGLNDLDVLDTYVWSDAPNEAPGYLKWSNGEPDNPNEHCVFMRNHDKKWADGNCAWSSPSVCKKRLPCMNNN